MAGKRWRKGRKNKEGASEAKFSTLVTYPGSKPGLPTKAVADGPGWAPLLHTISVKGWMKSSSSHRYILGSKHNLSLKGKMLVKWEGDFIWVSLWWAAVHRKLPAGSSPGGSWPGRWRPLTFSLALRTFCFPGRRKVVRRRGRHWEEHLGKKERSGKQLAVREPR